MPWQKPPDEWRTDMLSKKGSLKRPSTTSNKPVSQHNGLTRNDHSKKPHQGIKKIEGRLTLIYHARTDNIAPPNGSSRWMGERWPDTPRMTHQETSPSSPTSMPPKNTTMTTTMTLPGPYQRGLYPPWGGVVLPLPHS